VGQTCSLDKVDKKCIQNLVGKSPGNWPHRRMRMRLEDNIKMVLKERGCESVRQMELSQDCVH